MKRIELIEVNSECADDIWKFRQEILAFDAESENHQLNFKIRNNPIFDTTKDI